MKGLPKKLTICNRTWTIVYSNKNNGGFLDYLKSEIRVGIKDMTKELVVQYLLHEIIEAVLIGDNARFSQYTGTENGDYLFNFNHKEFEKIVDDIYSAIKPMLKNEVVK